MKLQINLLDHLTPEDMLEAVEANNHRYKPEPLFSKTGTGSLSSASIEERAKEAADSTDLIARVQERARNDGKKLEELS